MVFQRRRCAKHASRSVEKLINKNSGKLVRRNRRGCVCCWSCRSVCNPRRALSLVSAQSYRQASAQARVRVKELPVPGAHVTNSRGVQHSVHAAHQSLLSWRSQRLTRFQNVLALPNVFACTNLSSSLAEPQRLRHTPTSRPGFLQVSSPGSSIPRSKNRGIFSSLMREKLLKAEPVERFRLSTE